ncbi:MAG: hypothetical protein ACOVLD_02715 [Bacteroidia bacterium]
MEAFDGSSENKDAAKVYFMTIKGLCGSEYKEPLALSQLKEDILLKKKMPS